MNREETPRTMPKHEHSATEEKYLATSFVKPKNSRKLRRVNVPSIMVSGMTHSFKALVIGLALVFSGCGGCDKLNEIQQAAENIQELGKAAEHAEEATNLAQQRREERRKRGDTLAMPYQDLQKYLPADIGGYTANEPKGTTMNMTGMSYSSASREYSKANEATGESSSITVELLDYNSAADLYTGFTMLWGANFSMEDETKFTRTFDTGISDVVGWEEYMKQEKDATVTYAIGGRFILSVKANGNQSGTDFAKSVAKSMQLSELASK